MKRYTTKQMVISLTVCAVLSALAVILAEKTQLDTARHYGPYTCNDTGNGTERFCSTK